MMTDQKPDALELMAQVSGLPLSVVMRADVASAAYAALPLEGRGSRDWYCAKFACVADSLGGGRGADLGAATYCFHELVMAFSDAPTDMETVLGWLEAWQTERALCVIGGSRGEA